VPKDGAWLAVALSSRRLLLDRWSRLDIASTGITGIAVARNCALDKEIVSGWQEMHSGAGLFPAVDTRRPGSTCVIACTCGAPAFRESTTPSIPILALGQIRTRLAYEKGPPEAVARLGSHLRKAGAA